MISFTQNATGILGSQSDISALAQKEHARLLVYSDSHRNISIVRKIFLRYGKFCDAAAFCGDGIYDLLAILQEAQQDSSLAECIPPVIAFARGNGDPKETGPLIVPEKQILCINGTNILIVHGHHESVNFGLQDLALKAQYSDCKVALYGHTHVAKEVSEGGYKIINPGSVSQPRCGQEPHFAILTVEKKFTDAAFIEIQRPSTSDPDFKVKQHP